MPRLRLSVAARADLIDIRRYSIRAFGASVADDYMRAFKGAFALLREHPRLGQVRDDIGINMRCLVHRRHRIFYRVDADLTLIIRILHHARDVGPILKGES